MCIRDRLASAGGAAAGIGSSSSNGAGAQRQSWSPQEWEDWNLGAPRNGRTGAGVHGASLHLRA
eukprot:5395003-Alexandrium_andersonii.AAC.1